MKSQSFKCIFDPDKTITKIIPGHLVIQHENEYGNKYRTTLQPVDCFINVPKNSIINKSVDEISGELEIQNLQRAEDPLIGIEYNEYLETSTGNKIDNSSEGEGLRKRRLKRVINTKDGTEIEIYYRSIDEDKQFKKQTFKIITKIVNSKKTTDTTPTTNKTKKDILNLRKQAVYQRSINEDKLFKTKNYTKITKRLKSKHISGALTKSSENQVKKDFCNSERFGGESSKSESCFSKSLFGESYDLEASSSIATSNDISDIALIESDKTPSTAVLERHKIEIKDSIENNMLEHTHPVYSEISKASTEISDYKSKRSSFDKISADNLLENILFNSRFIYA